MSPPPSYGQTAAYFTLADAGLRRIEIEVCLSQMGPSNGRYRSAHAKSLPRRPGLIYSAPPISRGWRTLGCGPFRSCEYSRRHQIPLLKNINCSIAESLEHFTRCLHVPGSKRPCARYVSCVLGMSHEGAIDPSCVAERLPGSFCKWAVSRCHRRYDWCQDYTGVKALLTRLFQGYGCRQTGDTLPDTYGRALANIAH